MYLFIVLKEIKQLFLPQMEGIVCKSRAVAQL